MRVPIASSTHLDAFAFSVLAGYHILCQNPDRKLQLVVLVAPSKLNTPGHPRVITYSLRYGQLSILGYALNKIMTPILSVLVRQQDRYKIQ